MYNTQKPIIFFYKKKKKDTTIHQSIGMYRQSGRGKVIKKFLITFVRIT